MFFQFYSNQDPEPIFGNGFRFGSILLFVSSRIFQQSILTCSQVDIVLNEKKKITLKNIQGRIVCVEDFNNDNDLLLYALECSNNDEKEIEIFPDFSNKYQLEASVGSEIYIMHNNDDKIFGEILSLERIRGNFQYFIYFHHNNNNISQVLLNGKPVFLKKNDCLIGICVQYMEICSSANVLSFESILSRSRPRSYFEQSQRNSINKKLFELLKIQYNHQPEEEEVEESLSSSNNPLFIIKNNTTAMEIIVKNKKKISFLNKLLNNNKFLFNLLFTKKNKVY